VIIDDNYNQATCDIGVIATYL